MRSSTKQSECFACKGEGYFVDEDDNEHECEECGGTGVIWLDNWYEPDPDEEDMTPYKDNVLGD